MKTDKELIEPAKAVEFLTEAATYFARRPTGGEDAAHWSNVANAATCRRIAALISALSSPMPSREEVARLVDPEAWEEYLLEDGRVDEEVASIFQDAYEVSLVKADQILRLFSSSLGGGGEDSPSRSHGGSNA